MNNDFQNITIALAGIFQSAILVNEIAFKGQCDEVAYASLIESILKLDAQDVLSVYNGADKLTVGLTYLQDVFGANKSSGSTEVSRYVFSLFHLERKLSRQPAMLKKLASEIEKIQLKVNYFHLTHPNVIGALAELYKSTIGSFNFRLQITGKAEFLHQPDYADKCRALLLAGIRSTVLWRQVGGQRLQLLFSRRKIINQARQLLASNKPGLATHD